MPAFSAPRCSAGNDPDGDLLDHLASGVANDPHAFRSGADADRASAARDGPAWSTVRRAPRPRRAPHEAFYGQPDPRKRRCNALATAAALSCSPLHPRTRCIRANWHHPAASRTPQGSRQRLARRARRGRKPPDYSSSARCESARDPRLGASWSARAYRAGNERESYHRASTCSRNSSSRSHSSSAAASSACASPSFAEALSNAARSFAYRFGSAMVFDSFAISASSAAMRAGRVSSACLSLKVRRAFGALGAGASALSRGAFASFVDGPRRHAFAALRHHVGVAARIDVPAPAAFRDDHGRHGAVEEVAIVRDEQHGARIVVDHLFQQVERFEIEIVGRLVEHQQVRGFRERARKREAAALAAGERRRPASRPARARTGSPACSRRRGASGRRRTPCRRARRSACRAPRCPDRASRGAGRASPSRCWRRAAPCRRRAQASPVSMFSSVVLPAPFGPTSPMRSPRWMRIEKSRTTGSAPKLLEMLFASATSLPDSSASLTAIFTLPSAPRCSRKSLRSSCSNPTRRTLRLRRPDTP